MSTELSLEDMKKEVINAYYDGALNTLNVIQQVHSKDHVKKKEVSKAMADLKAFIEHKKKENSGAPTN